MKGVALVALLAAPAVVAFTPDNLKGVWSCKTLDKSYFEEDADYTADPPTSPSLKTGDEDKDAQRVVVFDDPDTKSVRRFTGRTYWLNDGNIDCVEEHAFSGVMTGPVDGTFYLNPNASNKECDASDIKGSTTKITFKSGNGLTEPTGNKVLNGQLAKAGVTLTDKSTSKLSDKCTDYGQCSEYAEGPWYFTFDDADHFTLTVDDDDAQRGQPKITTGAGGYHPHVFALEKCMRGLAEKDEMCEQLENSDISSGDEMNAACQGALVCDTCDGTSSGTKCCVMKKVEVPVYQPPYYYPQPQWSYYPQQQQWGGFYGGAYGR